MPTVFTARTCLEVPSQAGHPRGKGRRLSSVLAACRPSRPRARCRRVEPKRVVKIVAIAGGRPRLPGWLASHLAAPATTSKTARTRSSSWGRAVQLDPSPIFRERLTRCVTLRPRCRTVIVTEGSNRHTSPRRKRETATGEDKDVPWGDHGEGQHNVVGLQEVRTSRRRRRHSLLLVSDPSRLASRPWPTTSVRDASEPASY